MRHEPLPPTPGPAPSGEADLLLRGGRILTLDARDSTAEALAVRGGRIIAVGGERELSRLAGRHTRVVDLDGGAAIPGINDSHLHGAWLGAMWPRTLFGAADSGAPNPLGAPNLPDGRNDAGTGATELGLTEPGPDVEQRLLHSEADREAALLAAGRIAASFGITSYTEPGLGPGENAGPTGCFGEEVLATYRRLAADGRLTARITVLMLYGLLDGPSRLADFEAGLASLPAGPAGGRPHGPAERLLRVAGVKIFADGIPPMRNAWIHGCYPDGTHGTPLTDGATEEARAASLRAMIQAAHARGLQVGVHATGDRSIDAFIDAVAEAGKGYGDLRHYVIHGDLVGEAALRRLAGLGMGLNTQAAIALHTGDLLVGTLGRQAAAAAWPLRAALAAGVPLALSSDAPVTTPDWRLGLAAADEWMGDAGDPRARMGELLRCYTAAGAWQDHAEAYKGTLEVGKVADIAVLEADPYALAPADMPDVAVLHTVFDGRLIHSRDEIHGRDEAAVNSAAANLR
ncbi:amidohydrolase [Arthrobacter ginkgonis]|uniref:Amidohydrolase n=1 Tax=Arthrobacter ginkgonis TaxID=1630594 RepID=A0ABP7CZX8_9MICC